MAHGTVPDHGVLPTAHIMARTRTATGSRDEASARVVDVLSDRAETLTFTLWGRGRTTIRRGENVRAPSSCSPRMPRRNGSSSRYQRIGAPGGNGGTGRRRFKEAASCGLRCGELAELWSYVRRTAFQSTGADQCK